MIGCVGTNGLLWFFTHYMYIILQFYSLLFILESPLNAMGSSLGKAVVNYLSAATRPL